MYSIASSLYGILAIVLIAFQGYRLYLGYNYPVVLFGVLTVIAVLLAVYYFCMDRKAKRSKWQTQTE